MTLKIANRKDPMFTTMVRYAPRYWKVIFLLIAGAAFLLGGSTSRATDSRIAAPDWQLSDVEGKPVKLSDFKGKVVILDFWATWCPPCRAEVPDFVRLQAKYRDKGLSVVGLSLDAEGAKVVRPFAEEYNVNYVMLIANDETTRSFGGVVGIPTTFVLDRTGKIVSKFIGKTE